MEATLYTRVLSFLTKGKKFEPRDRAVIKSNEDYWKEQFSKFELRSDDVITLNSKTVPTVQQAEDCLRTVHYRGSGHKHIYQEKILLDTLKAANFDLPMFVGGLSHFVRE